ncbi:MAG: histidinol-phosphatase [Spirochaetaceae bacterium]|jgi:histidinol-phosphatase (PHP family)|nr:histidinol-phosphatase [Spirochaetaceae bacterium]GMO27063.1 MAG: histidinol-phosphatase [Termitinemataceae bacterium]
MRLSCTHTHTCFCDGKGSIGDFCAAAVQKGFTSLGFSAHAPLPKELGIKSDWHLSHENCALYIEQTLEAKEKWRGRLEVYLGMEIDYIDGYMSPADSFFRNLALDYSIGSVHCVIPAGKSIDWAREFGEAFLCVDGSAEDYRLLLEKGFGGDKRALTDAYYDSLSAMCRAGGFDVLGHADLVVKNNRSYIYDEHYSKRVEDFAAELKQNGAIAELNTGGVIRGKTKAFYPAPKFLKTLFLNKINITVNADAHCPEHLGGCYEAAFAALREAGYTEHFILHKGIWQAEAL